jgi:PAS domain S-box-containing protein
METESPELGAELESQKAAEAVLTAMAESFFPNPEMLFEPAFGAGAQAPAADEGPWRTRQRGIGSCWSKCRRWSSSDIGQAHRGSVCQSAHRSAAGFTHREWLEEPVRWYRQIHLEDKVRWSIDASKVFLTGEPLHAVYRVMSEDGRVIWFQCQAKMVRGEDGRPLLVHSVGFDITELKETEASLTEALAAAQAANKAEE